MNAAAEQAIVRDTPHSDHAQCVVSERLSCIFVAIAKNASSTIRAILRAADDELADRRCGEIAAETWERSTVFTFLRDPVSRAVSAYHEVSIRLDAGLLGPLPFQHDPPGPDRFEAFLDCIEARPFDEHARSQADLIGTHRIDFWGNFDFLNQDVQQLFGRLERPAPSEIPHLRRRGRAPGTHGLEAADLSPATLERVRRIYRRDFELLAEVLPSSSRRPSIAPW